MSGPSRSRVGVGSGLVRDGMGCALTIVSGFVQGTGPGDPKIERLTGPYLRQDPDKGVGLARVLHRLKSNARHCRELHAPRHHHDEVLGCVECLGINVEFAAILHVKDDLKFSVARADGEDKSVTVFIFLGDRRRVDGRAAIRLGHALIDLCAIGEKELEVSSVHLGARRIRSVVQRK